MSRPPPLSTQESPTKRARTEGPLPTPVSPSPSTTSHRPSLALAATPAPLVQPSHLSHTSSTTSTTASTSTRAPQQSVASTPVAGQSAATLHGNSAPASGPSAGSTTSTPPTADQRIQRMEQYIVQECAAREFESRTAFLADFERRMDAVSRSVNSPCGNHLRAQPGQAAVVDARRDVFLRDGYELIGPFVYSRPMSTNELGKSGAAPGTVKLFIEWNKLRVGLDAEIEKTMRNVFKRSSGVHSNHKNNNTTITPANDYWWMSHVLDQIPFMTAALSHVQAVAQPRVLYGPGDRKLDDMMGFNELQPAWRDLEIELRTSLEQHGFDKNARVEMRKPDELWWGKSRTVPSVVYPSGLQLWRKFLNVPQLATIDGPQTFALTMSNAGVIEQLHKNALALPKSSIIVPPINFSSIDYFASKVQRPKPSDASMAVSRFEVWLRFFAALNTTAGPPKSMLSAGLMSSPLGGIDWTFFSRVGEQIHKPGDFLAALGRGIIDSFSGPLAPLIDVVNAVDSRTLQTARQNLLARSFDAKFPEAVKRERGQAGHEGAVKTKHFVLHADAKEMKAGVRKDKLKAKISAALNEIFEDRQTTSPDQVRPAPLDSVVPLDKQLLKAADEFAIELKEVLGANSVFERTVGPLIRMILSTAAPFESRSLFTISNALANWTRAMARIESHISSLGKELTLELSRLVLFAFLAAIYIPSIHLAASYIDCKLNDIFETAAMRSQVAQQVVAEVAKDVHGVVIKVGTATTRNHGTQIGKIVRQFTHGDKKMHLLSTDPRWYLAHLKNQGGECMMSSHCGRTLSYDPDQRIKDNHDGRRISVGAYERRSMDSKALLDGLSTREAYNCMYGYFCHAFHDGIFALHSRYSYIYHHSDRPQRGKPVRFARGMAGAGIPSLDVLLMEQDEGVEEEMEKEMEEGEEDSDIDVD